MNILKSKEINLNSLTVKEKFELLIEKCYGSYKGEEYVNELKDIKSTLEKISSLTVNQEDEDDLIKIEKFLDRLILDNRNKDIKLFIFKLFHLIELALKGIKLL